MNGWRPDEDPEKKQTVYLNMGDTFQELNDMLKSLEELEGEKCLQEKIER